MIPKICAAALLAAFVGVILSEMGFKGKRLFSAIAIIALLLFTSEGVATLFKEINRLSALADVGDAAKSGAKIIGVGYIFGICSDICEELGERGISSALSIAGRIEIVIIVLPYISKIISLGLELIK